MHVSLSGSLPGNDIQVQLPVFADAGVRSVIGGSTTPPPTRSRCTAASGGSCSASPAKPTVAVQTASTVPGTHSQPR